MIFYKAFGECDRVYGPWKPQVGCWLARSRAWPRWLRCWRCVDLWRVFSMLRPSSPFGSKAVRWAEKPVQAKQHVTSIPESAQPCFRSSRPGNGLLGGEGFSVDLSGPREHCFRAQCCAVLEPMLIVTHYMYNLPQICHWNEHALDVYLRRNYAQFSIPTPCCWRLLKEKKKSKFLFFTGTIIF